MNKHVMVCVEMDDGGSRRCLGCNQYVYGSLTELPPGECPTPYKSPKQLLAESVAREAALRLELGRTIEAKEHRMDELAAALKELALWKSNHANMVERTKLLRDRPDMPVERIAAFERMGALQQRLTAVESRNMELTTEVERRDALLEELGCPFDSVSDIYPKATVLTIHNDPLPNYKVGPIIDAMRD